MEIITKEELTQRRENIATEQGLACSNDVRCYNCKAWGYNRGKAMNSMGESRCILRKERTASFQWCKRFVYIGNSQ